MIPSLHPLQVNEKTGELFLRLNKHPHIILTPPRLSDASNLVSVHNDERVCTWLSGPPYPYLLEHAQSFLAEIVSQSEMTVSQLLDTNSDDPGHLFEYPPVRYIREVKEDGTEIFLGDIAFVRCSRNVIALGSTTDDLDLDTLFVQNNDRELGDPAILWTVGDYLAPSHHGQGIMSDALGTLLQKWGIPRMGIRKMIGIAFKGNIGSVKVMEKSGFIYRETREQFMEVKGQKVDCVVLDWRLEGYPNQD